MKKKQTHDSTRVKGFYINELTRGFFGDHYEGKEMLKRMGLPSDTVPFSVAVFLVTISFKLKLNQLECFGTYLKKRKSIRLFREWGNHEDPEVIARLESEAIGDCCMRCIYENLIE